MSSRTVGGQIFRRWRADNFADVFRVLIGHETAGDFGGGPGGHDGLAAFALVAAGQAVDFKGGAGAALFGGGEAAFAKEFRRAEQFLEVPHP